MDFFGKFVDLLSCLPPRLVYEVERMAKSYPRFSCEVTELRLRREQVASLTVGGAAVALPVVLTGEELDRTLMRLGEGSLYAHRETLSHGEMLLPSGCRVGVVGRAVGEGSFSLRDVSSLVFRLPRRIVGAADGAYRFFAAHAPRGLLVFSPPGVGKTTLLLDLAVRLASGPRPRSVVILDGRGEFSSMLSGGEGLLDLMIGYPREAGAAIALRSLSPEILVTDEIGSPEEGAALADCVNGGVTVIASAHGGSTEDLFRRRAPRELVEIGVFSALYRLYREEGEVRGEGIPLPIGKAPLTAV